MIVLQVDCSIAFIHSVRLRIVQLVSCFLDNPFSLLCFAVVSHTVRCFLPCAGRSRRHFLHLRARQPTSVPVSLSSLHFFLFVLHCVCFSSAEKFSRLCVDGVLRKASLLCLCATMSVFVLSVVYYLQLGLELHHCLGWVSEACLCLKAVEIIKFQ